jgi:hypothetical protein
MMNYTIFGPLNCYSHILSLGLLQMASVTRSKNRFKADILEYNIFKPDYKQIKKDNKKLIEKQKTSVTDDKNNTVKPATTALTEENSSVNNDSSLIRIKKLLRSNHWIECSYGSVGDDSHFVAGGLISTEREAFYSKHRNVIIDGDYGDFGNHVNFSWAEVSVRYVDDPRRVQMLIEKFGNGYGDYAFLIDGIYHGITSVLEFKGTPDSEEDASICSENDNIDDAGTEKDTMNDDNDNDDNE